MKIYHIWQKLKNTTSILKKLEILENNKNNTQLKDYFYWCCNSSKFGIKKLPEIIQTPQLNNEWNDIIQLLSDLTERKITGNKALSAYQQLSSELDTETRTILENMVQKNPRCGVSRELVNKIWTNLIPKEIKLCKAQPYSEKTLSEIVYPAVSQRKCDGARCLAFCTNNEIHFYTSSGKEYYKLDQLADQLSFMANDDVVLDGELLVYQFDKVSDRKTGNGILNKSIHNTISKEESNNVHFIVWDMISIEDYYNDKGTVPYDETIQELYKLIVPLHNIHVVETRIVNSKEEALDHFRYMLARGEEGTILKNKKMLWEGKRSKNCVKFKVVMQSTLKVVDIQEGTEKLTGKLGALLCESEDGLVQVKVGSGFSDEQRDEYFTNDMIGHYVEIESNGIIQATDGTFSLFLPRFIEDRTYEKQEADTKEMIQALSDGSSMLLN